MASILTDQEVNALAVYISDGLADPLYQKKEHAVLYDKIREYITQWNDLWKRRMVNDFVRRRNG